MSAIRPWYDNKEEMAIRCQTLEGFHAVCAARSVAAREGKESLTAFVVAGTWVLDRFGQVASVTKVERWDEENRRYDEVVTHRQPDFPVVLTEDEFCKALPPETTWGWGFGGRRGMPPKPWQVCPCCNKGWTMANTGDTITVREDLTIPLTEFVGQRLSVVEEAYRRRPEAVYYLSRSSPIRNDRWINNDPHPSIESLVKNAQGWATGSHDGGEFWPRIDCEEYAVQEGDEAGFAAHVCYHEACYAHKLAVATRDALLAEVTNAGFYVYGAIRATNEYGSGSYRGPWWVIDTDLGTIRAGWRKRVIDIDYSGVSYYEVPDVDVTKSPGHIHAYSYEDMRTYLTCVRQHVSSNETN
jgi:hypothetical protein